MATGIVSQLNSPNKDSKSERKRSTRRLARIAETAQRAAKRRRERLLAHPLAIKHKRRGITQRFVELRTAGASGVAAFLAVLGPGMLAGLSDDDPAGITTYSVLGAEHGYRLLWIIPASTILLIYFHLLAVRIGAASGKGLQSKSDLRYCRHVRRQHGHHHEHEKHALGDDSQFVAHVDDDQFH